MKIKVLSFFVLLFFPSLLTAEVKDSAKAEPVVPMDGQVVDKVIASLDGEPVTFKDLRKYVEDAGEPRAEERLQQHDYLMKALHELLLGKMLEKEAETQKISVSDDDVKAYVEEIKRQNGVDEAGFEQILKDKEMDLNSYSAQVRQDILRSRVVHKLMRSKITVSSEDINRYFDDHPDRKPVAGTVRLHQYTVTLPEGAESEQRERARQTLNDVAAKIKNGTPLQGFPEGLHRDLGYVRTEELREDFQKAVAKLDVNTPSEIVTTNAGVFLFVVASRVAKDGEVDESLREEIKTELLNKQYGSALDKFLNDELPKKYTVEFKI